MTWQYLITAHASIFVRLTFGANRVSSPPGRVALVDVTSSHHVGEIMRFAGISVGKELVPLFLLSREYFNILARSGSNSKTRPSPSPRSTLDRCLAQHLDVHMFLSVPIVILMWRRIPFLACHKNPAMTQYLQIQSACCPNSPPG